jgi:SNF2 family DNA or RNA helicase
MWESCTAARKLANRHNAQLFIGPDLTAWAQAEKQRLASVPDVSAETAELFNITGKLRGAMRARPFQEVGAAFAARNRYALIADDPGLGKTLQSIGAVIEAGIHGLILVVAPKSAVYDTWPREINLWSPGDKIVIVGPHMKPAQRKAVLDKLIATEARVPSGQRTWVIVGPNYLRAKAQTDSYGHYVYDPATRKPLLKHVGEALPQFHEIEWDAVIVDEAHRYLSGATGNVKKQSGQRQGLGALTIRPHGLRLALSGTPFRGKLHNSWGLANWLRPDLYRAYWSWIDRHFDVLDNGWGKKIGQAKDEDALYQELSQFMVRRTKAEVAKDLPPKMYAGTPLDADEPNSPVAVWLTMDDEQYRIYKEMESVATAELLSGDILNANGILAIMTRLKQFACSAAHIVGETVEPAMPSNKLAWLIEWLAERGIDGTEPVTANMPKVVVGSQFRRLLEMFSAELAALGIESYLFTGSTSQAERKRIVEDWQNTESTGPRVLLLTTTAGGVSLTLDAATDDLIMLDETWVPDDTIQLEDRIHRLSRMHQVTIWKLKSLGTIEESIARDLEAKGNSIFDVLDGARGLERARVLLNP